MEPARKEIKLSVEPIEDVHRQDVHLGEERFIELLEEYDRLGGEERDLEALKASCQQQAADADKLPRSAPSMTEWNAERERRRADLALTAKRLKETDERLRAIASRRQEILAGLVSRGMPQDRWIGYAEHYVLVRRVPGHKPAGQAPAGEEKQEEAPLFSLELRRVLREALDEAPEGQSVGEIEKRSARIERERAMGPLRRTAARAAAAGSYVSGGCVAVVVLLLSLAVKGGRRLAPYAEGAGIALGLLGLVGGVFYGSYLPIEHFPPVYTFIAWLLVCAFAIFYWVVREVMK